MFLYVQKSFKVSSTGQELKDVTCEKCGAAFCYLLSRTTTGRSSTPYFVAQEAARRRAENHAKARLKKRLKRDAELVPCPQCHWVNHELIRHFRRSQYRRISAAAGFFLGAGAFTALLFYIHGIADPAGATGLEIAAVASATVLIVFVLLLSQFLLRRGIDPNRNADGHPLLPVGTPPALLKIIDRVTHQKGLAPVPSDLSNLQAEAQWATFRPGQLALDPLCCQCLEPAETHFRFPIPIDSNTLQVPLCEVCLKKIQAQWWLRNLAAIPFAVAAGYGLSLFDTPRDFSGRMMIVAFVACFLTLVAVVINDRMLRPYRMRTADRSRNIVRIRFANPAYTALLIRKLGQQDGLYKTAATSEEQTVSTK